MFENGTVSISKVKADEIISLFQKYGNEDYDGEPVSQTSHMAQCAMLAMKDGNREITIGAFLHDIGHLLKHENTTQAMGKYGVVNHEGIGAEYLKERGFSERICAVVAMHVAAKRYLVATDEKYALKLSVASRETLKWQGGPMTSEEIRIFRLHPFFEDIIKVRLWDEKAKDYNAPILPLDFFHQFINNYLNDTISR
jgi:phosphonate degradation associated HDIG domain protein